MQEYMFAGTYTATKSRGIYGFSVKDGLVYEPELLAERVSPTYLCVNRDQTVLYAVDEPEEGSGTLGAYQIVKDENGLVTGLSLLNNAVAPSSGICHVVLSPDERFLLCTAYFDAKVSVWRIEQDGSIGELTDCIQRVGSGPNPVRQPCAHAHSVTFAPDGSFLYVCDLGTDDLAAYRLTEEGRLVHLPEYSVHVPGGYGPRHMTFSPDGQWCYVAAEIVDHLLVYRFQNGKMDLEQDLLATKVQDPAYTSAAVRVTKDGQFVYISNRGEETVTAYEVQPDGALIELQNLPSMGRTPREFTLSLDETMAFTGNQDEDTVGVYSRDAKTGLLTPCGCIDTIGQPVCLLPIRID